MGSAGRLRISAIFLKHPTFEGSFFTLLWTKKYRIKSSCKYPQLEFLYLGVSALKFDQYLIEKLPFLIASSGRDP